MSYTPITVTLNSFTFDGATQTPSSSGILWDWQDLSGWFDTADQRFDQHEVGIGSSITVDRRNGRPITLTVLAHALHDGRRLDDLVYTAQRTLKAAVSAAVDVPVLLKVNEPSVALQAYVRQTGPIRTKVLGTRHLVQFQIPLIAPDPRRYSQTEHMTSMAAGSHTIANAGDLPAPVILEAATGTNPTFQNTTADGDPTLAVTGSGDIIVNTDTEAVTIGGTPNRSALTQFHWWSLVPGNNTIVVSDATDITWRDAYS